VEVGGVVRHVDGKMRKREGALGVGGGRSSGRHRPPLGDAAVQQWRAAGRVRLIGGAGRQRGPVGSGWVREGEAARRRC
jgi:hypothetical protein